MKIKATKNFSGLIAMSQGEERDVRKEIAEDLIGAGYAEIIGAMAKDPNPEDTDLENPNPEDPNQEDTDPENPNPEDPNQEDTDPVNTETDEKSEEKPDSGPAKRASAKK